MNRRSFLVAPFLGVVGLTRLGFAQVASLPAVTTSNSVGPCHSLLALNTSQREAASSQTLRRRTVVLIDRTTPANRAALDALKQRVREAASGAGMEILTLSFAALSRDEGVRLLAHTSNEPELPNDAQLASVSLAKRRRAAECLQWQRQNSVERSLAALPAANGDLSTNASAHSEIAYFVREIVTKLSNPGVTTEFLIYSDGFEHSMDGHSFYAGGESRRIDPAAELARLKSRQLLEPVSVAPGSAISLTWFGLATRPNKQYMPPSEFEALASFWRQALDVWGVRSVRIDALTPLAHRN